MCFRHSIPLTPPKILGGSYHRYLTFMGEKTHREGGAEPRLAIGRVLSPLAFVCSSIVSRELSPNQGQDRTRQAMRVHECGGK